MLVGAVRPHVTYWLFSAALLLHAAHAVLLALALNLPVPHARHCWIRTLAEPELTETIAVPSGRSVPAGQFAHTTLAVPVLKHPVDTPMCALHLALSGKSWPWHRAHALDPCRLLVVQMVYMPAPQSLPEHGAQTGSLVFVLAPVL